MKLRTLAAIILAGLLAFIARAGSVDERTAIRHADLIRTPLVFVPQRRNSITMAEARERIGVAARRVWIMCVAWWTTEVKA